jgi:hypothetical protein
MKMRIEPACNLRSKRLSTRRGSISPKAIIAIVIVLVIGGLLKYATSPATDIQLVNKAKVTPRFVSGQAVNLEKLRFQLSMSGLDVGIPTQMQAMAKAAAKEQNPDEPEDPEEIEGDTSRVLSFQPDANGAAVMAHIQLSRDFLERNGKVKNLEAVISTPDISLKRTTGEIVEPVFVVSGVRATVDSPKGKRAQFNFGGGNTFSLPEPAPQELWFAKGQIKSTQEFSSTVDVICLFPQPPGSGDLILNIVGTEFPLGPIE